MAPRPPADAVVALRGLGRRFRGLFAGLGDDESPDDVAHRAGAGGRSGLDHIVHATATVTTAARAIDLVLTEDSPSVTVSAPWAEATAGTVEEGLAELGWEADALADRVQHVGAEEWARPAMLPDGAITNALEVVWAAVDGAVDDLKQAELVLREVRRRP